jgi:hypothetical protein
MIYEIVAIFRVSLVIENGVSTTKRVEVARMMFGGAAIKDLKFVDDVHLMLIYHDSGKTAANSLRESHFHTVKLTL